MVRALSRLSSVAHFFLASPTHSRSPSPSPHDTLTLRALVSTKDAGVIIGRAGKNVADLRDQTGVKAGVSKVIPGVPHRVLTISGGCEAISRAYAIVAKCLLEGAPMVSVGMLGRDGDRDAPTSHST